MYAFQQGYARNLISTEQKPFSFFIKEERLFLFQNLLLLLTSHIPQPSKSPPIRKTHRGSRHAKSIPSPSAAITTPHSHFSGAPLHLLRNPATPFLIPMPEKRGMCGIFSFRSVLLFNLWNVSRKDIRPEYQFPRVPPQARCLRQYNHRPAQDQNPSTGRKSPSA